MLHPVDSHIVDEVMHRVPVAVHPESTLADAVAVMSASGAHSLPVIDGQARLVGTLSARDLRMRTARLCTYDHAEFLDERVSDVMTLRPTVVRAGSSLDDAIRYLDDQVVGELPVVDEQGHVLGVLAFVDALAWIARTARRQPFVRAA